MRVIAGKVGGRKLVAPKGGARPTTDRLKEALFSSLGPEVHDATVLDLYAGSGALAIEALSRGAASALLVDSDLAATTAIRANLATTGFEGVARVERISVERFVTAPIRDAPFDLVFLDPPFSQDLLLPACTLLEERGWLADDAWVYTESEQVPSSLGMPGNWRLHREQKAGQVHYALWERRSA